MTDTETNRGGRFIPAVLPWLLGGAMLIVYVLTLVHTATPATMNRMSLVNHWTWQPAMYAPLHFLLTYPVHWLPEASRLTALNLFSALCAALTLVLLARSVMLLPHDRTNAQREREHSEFSILSIPTAWLPPLFAVLVCGLQLTFWERAVEFRDTSFVDNGEMLHLLVFAYAIRCLLEYRIGLKESWLTRFALVCGLGMANNWAMVGFFPFFLGAVIWIKGFDFFDWRFVLRMFLCGLAGFSLILFLPLASQLHHYQDLNFWQTLKPLLLADHQVLLSYPGFAKSWLLLFAFTAVVPAILISVRWAASFGDNSPLGILLATSAFNFAYGFLMLATLWVALDGPISPRVMVPQPPGTPFLSFHYLGALCVGYFCGYFLLVCGRNTGGSRQKTPGPVRWLRRAAVAAVWLLAVAAPLALLAKNLPSIRQYGVTAGRLDRGFARMLEQLPARNAVILSDIPEALSLLRSSIIAQPQPRPGYVFLDTSALSASWNYVRYLDEQNPGDDIAGVFTHKIEGQPPGNVDCVRLLEKLAATREIYYLHPSFGYYFERFYAQPQGLVYRLHFYPTNSWLPTRLTTEQVAGNQQFWMGMTNDLQALVTAMQPQAPPENPNLWERFRKFAHLAPDEDKLAASLGAFYSRSVDNWGVELQRSAPPDQTNVWQAAGAWFALARQLNPASAPARLNLEFNQDTLAGHLPEFKHGSVEDKIGGNYRLWFEAANAGGPFDEPNICEAFGWQLREGQNFRQAVDQFDRLQKLIPGSVAAPLLWSDTLQLFLSQPRTLNNGYPEPDVTLLESADAADRALRVAPIDQTALSLKSVALLRLGYLLQIQTNRPHQVTLTFQETYSNCLATVDRWLGIAPAEPQALYLKASSLMQLGEYSRALDPWGRMIAGDPSNAVPYISRGTAYLNLEKFDAAKADYQNAVKLLPNPFQAYFGLGEVAYGQKDKAAAIANYELCLTNMPAEWKTSAEFKHIEARLQELKSNLPPP